MAACLNLRSTSYALRVVAIGLVAWLAIDVAILCHWLADLETARLARFSSALLVVMGAFVASLISRLRKETRARAARRIDAALPALGESLDALVYLERQQEDPFAGSYAKRIGRHAADVLRRSAIPFPYPRERARVVLLAAACGGAVLMIVQLERWTELWGALEIASTKMDDAADALEAPDSAAPEVVSEWGEVRVTEPGRDLRVTKVDVVPLEIEAATSGELVGVRWFTAKSGEAEIAHSLPEPEDPHHALFTPHLHVDELRLSDWDVVAYHAGASTAGGRELSSRIYFLEIRPFREEILRLEEGDPTRQKAFALLGEISGLIDRQKHVVRETHQHLRQPRRSPEGQRSDREKLRGAEQEVLEASQHLYARVAAEMENQPVAETLDHLALAHTDLAKAVAALGEPDGEPLAPEQGALRHLIATRKIFHDVVVEGGEGDPSSRTEEELGPIAGLDDQLRQTTELRNERTAVRDEVGELLEAQRVLAERVESTPTHEMPPHAEPQRSLRGRLAGLAELHPRPFVRSREALQVSLDSMDAAHEDLLSARASGASQREAVTRLEALHASLEAEAARDDLTAAYELRQRLDLARERLADLETNPSSLEDDEIRELGGDVRRAARALDGALPGGLPALGDLERALEALERAAADAARSRAAGAARHVLQEIEADLERRTPELVRRLRDRNPLQESPEEALDDAVRQLRALAAEGEAREWRPEEQEKVQRDVLPGLAVGLERLYDAAEARSVLALVEEDLKGEGFDPARLRELVSKIESRRVEIRESEEREADKQALVRTDPTRLAPDYRRRVEEYFRRLSER
jgi:hypothetical protein